jgi:hypothetical protein
MSCSYSIGFGDRSPHVCVIESSRGCSEKWVCESVLQVPESAIYFIEDGRKVPAMG